MKFWRIITSAIVFIFILPTLLWYLGVIAIWPNLTSKENFFTEIVPLKETIDFQDSSKQAQSCQADLQSSMTANSSKASIVDFNFLDDISEKKLLDVFVANHLDAESKKYKSISEIESENSIEFSFKDGLIRRRFKMYISDGLDESEDEYTAFVTAKEINFIPTTQKIYYGSLRKNKEYFELILVNHFNSKKNVIKISKVSDLSYHCINRDEYLLENIYNVTETSGHANNHHTEMPINSIGAKNCSFQMPQAIVNYEQDWPKIESQKNIIFKPIYLIAADAPTYNGAGPIEKKRIIWKPLSVNQRQEFKVGLSKNDNIYDSIKEFGKAQKAIFCQIPENRRNGISVFLGEENISDDCQVFPTDELSTENNTPITVGFYEVKKREIFRYLSTYVNEETYLNELKKISTQDSAYREIRQKHNMVEELLADISMPNGSLIENSGLANGHNLPSNENSFEIPLLICQDSKEFKCVNWASTIGVTRDRNWVLMRQESLSGYLISHEVSHLYGLTHTSRGSMDKWPYENICSGCNTDGICEFPNGGCNKRNAFHDKSNFSKPSPAIINNNVYYTAENSQNDDRFKGKDDRLTGNEFRHEYTPFPSAVGLSCEKDLPAQNIDFCDSNPASNEKCNGLKNTLIAYGKILDLIEPEPEDDHFDIEIKFDDKIEFGKSIKASWEGELKRKANVTISNVVDNEKVLSAVIDEGALEPKLFENNLAVGSYVITVDFDASEYEIRHEIEVLKPKPKSILLENPDLIESSPHSCEIKGHSFCNYQVLSSQLECVGGVEFSRQNCGGSLYGCGDIKSNLANNASNKSLRLFLIGSADYAVNDEFSNADNNNLAVRRGSYLGERFASQLDKKDFLVCPQIGTKLDGLCGNIDFNPQTEKYAAAFVYSGEKFEPNYDGRCGIDKCPANQELFGGKCLDICQNDWKRASDGVCYPPPCLADQTRAENGICLPTPCLAGLIRIEGECTYPPCPEGKIRAENGVCLQTPCPIGQIRSEGSCTYLPCPAGQIRTEGMCTYEVCSDKEVRDEYGVCTIVEVEKNGFQEAVLLILSLATLLAL